MAARGISRGGPGEGRFFGCIGVALLAHVFGLGAARRMERAPSLPPLDVMSARIDVAAEPQAVSAKPPAPLPPEPPRVAERPRPVARPTMRPTVTKAPPTPSPAPEEKEDVAAHLSSALSAVAAEATKILSSTQGDGPPIASGKATAPAYGMVAGDGTSTTPTFEPRAGLQGRPGGSAPPPPVPSRPDRSRGAQYFTGFTGDCDFPAKADRARVDHGWAEIVVSVRSDGTASKVVVMGDSGYDFGLAARACALRQRYRPALDRDGKPIAADTPTIRYRFTR